MTTPQNPTRLDGISGASDSGGTAIQIDGEGFADQLTGPIQLTDSAGGSSSGTVDDYRVVSGDQVDSSTPEINPGLDDVQLYTVSGCGVATAADEVRATSPAGPAGTKVPVTVQTVESYFTGAGRGSTSAGFTYNR